VATRAGSHGDQAVSALLDRLVRELVVDDVVHHHAAIAVRGLVDFLARPSEVMMTGTLYFTHMAMSCSSGRWTCARSG